MLVLFSFGGGGRRLDTTLPSLGSRTYGDTQISTSRMLRKYLVYGTPFCTNNLASSIYSTVRFICGMKEFLSVACHIEREPDHA